MHLVRYFVLATVSLSLTAVTARADLIGSSVTGAYFDGAGAVNLFDPTVSTNVIPAGYLNQSGTTVTIEPNQLQFGTELCLSAACNLITAVFTDTQLDIHTHAGFSFGLLGFPDTFHFTFTDSAFTGVSLVSSTFQKIDSNGNWTPAVIDPKFSGDTINIDIVLSALAGSDYDAVFDVSPAAPTSPVPEAPSFLWPALGLTAVLAGIRGRVMMTAA